MKRGQWARFIIEGSANEPLHFGVEDFGLLIGGCIKRGFGMSGSEIAEHVIVRI